MVELQDRGVASRRATAAGYRVPQLDTGEDDPREGRPLTGDLRLAALDGKRPHEQVVRTKIEGLVVAMVS